ncbi:hypothetical protein DEU56DRAFT_752065 [Suillus clintonianus]|uniref:uncharacterized protein n=1 Tax=Suillus clintonianus TaxID=1904413 RepID=UPI001B85E774|nr:uncharacterized protein DEU56DRAFT_752065 [Suillus clintonianus]KAG2152763.1 hypothetical protein DEU56DRAFT_752065 [Suillus clintonianus]
MPAVGRPGVSEKVVAQPTGEEKAYEVKLWLLSKLKEAAVISESAVLEKFNQTVGTAAARYLRVWVAVKTLSAVLDKLNWDAELLVADVRGMSKRDIWPTQAPTREKHQRETSINEGLEEAPARTRESGH